MNTKSFYSIFIIGIIVLSIGFFVDNAKADPITWYDEDWHYCKQITLNKNQVVNTMINFPVLINLSSDDGLKGHAQSDGDDIIFVDSTNTSKYNHEIEYYNSATGQLVVWVNVTTLSSAINTIIYMYYGNGACSNQQNVVNTWDSNYVCVYHMNGSGGVWTKVYDSTVYANHLNKSGSTATNEVAGKIGYAQDFDKSTNEELTVNGTVSNLPIGNNDFSIECFVETDTTPANGDYDGIVGWGYPFVWYHRTGIYKSGSATRFRSWEVGAYGDIGAYTSNEITVNIWYSVSMRYDNIEEFEIYMNGTSKMTNDLDTAGTMAVSSGTPLTVGYENNDTSYFDGTIDEVRISKISRNDSYFATVYNTENNCTSGGFFTIYGEVDNLPESEIFIENLTPDYIYNEDFIIEIQVNNSLEYNMSFTVFIGHPGTGTPTKCLGGYNNVTNGSYYVQCKNFFDDYMVYEEYPGNFWVNATDSSGTVNSTYDDDYNDNYQVTHDYETVFKTYANAEVDFNFIPEKTFYNINDGGVTINISYDTNVYSFNSINIYNETGNLLWNSIVSEGYWNFGEQFTNTEITYVNASMNYIGNFSGTYWVNWTDENVTGNISIIIPSGVNTTSIVVNETNFLSLMGSILFDNEQFIIVIIFMLWLFMLDQDRKQKDKSYYGILQFFVALPLMIIFSLDIFLSSMTLGGIAFNVAVSTVVFYISIIVFMSSWFKGKKQN